MGLWVFHSRWWFQGNAPPYVVHGNFDYCLRTLNGAWWKDWIGVSWWTGLQIWCECGQYNTTRIQDISCTVRAPVFGRHITAPQSITEKPMEVYLSGRMICNNKVHTLLAYIFRQYLNSWLQFYLRRFESHLLHSLKCWILVPFNTVHLLNAEFLNQRYVCTHNTSIHSYTYANTHTHTLGAIWKQMQVFLFQMHQYIVCQVSMPLWVPWSLNNSKFTL